MSGAKFQVSVAAGSGVCQPAGSAGRCNAGACPGPGGVLAGVGVSVSWEPGLLTLFFAPEPPRDYEEAIRRAFGQTADSVIVGWLPLYHDMGLVGFCMLPLSSGTDLVLGAPQDFLAFRALGKRFGKQTQSVAEAPTARFMFIKGGKIPVETATLRSGVPDQVVRGDPPSGDRHRCRSGVAEPHLVER